MTTVVPHGAELGRTLLASSTGLMTFPGNLQETVQVNLETDASCAGYELGSVRSLGAV